MTSYLYYVQDEQGREVVSAHVDVEKVSDVHGRSIPLMFGEREVSLMFEDVEIERNLYIGDSSLTLYRVPSDDKLAKPVSHPLS